MVLVVKRPPGVVLTAALELAAAAAACGKLFEIMFVVLRFTMGSEILEEDKVEDWKGPGGAPGGLLAIVCIPTRLALVIDTVCCGTCGCCCSIPAGGGAIFRSMPPLLVGPTAMLGIGGAAAKRGPLPPPG